MLLIRKEVFPRKGECEGEGGRGGRGWSMLIQIFRQSSKIFTYIYEVDK